jgi:nucleotide-binding universal stress UspA family protein
VPYDGSRFADKALEHAIAIAKLSEVDAQIILLHIVPEIPIPLAFERPVRSPKTGKTIALTEYIKELYEEIKTNASKMLEKTSRNILLMTFSSLFPFAEHAEEFEHLIYHRLFFESLYQKHTSLS